MKGRLTIRKVDSIVEKSHVVVECTYWTPRDGWNTF